MAVRPSRIKHLPPYRWVMKMEIDKANIRIATELGKKPSLLAYPYGEYSSSVRQIIIDRGFDAAYPKLGCYKFALGQICFASIC